MSCLVGTIDSIGSLLYYITFIRSYCTKIKTIIVKLLGIHYDVLTHFATLREQAARSRPKEQYNYQLSKN